MSAGDSSRRTPGRIGPYQIERELGRGGMGIVYRARDAAGHTVALKVLVGPAIHGDRKKRFGREGDALAALQHPNVVRYVGSGEGPPSWLAMEFLDGRSLAAVLGDEAPLAPERAASLVAGIARGIAHAHEHGIVHRDLKPANVIVRRDGTPVVTDFGLAKDLDASVLTEAGVSLGTLHYMAPEQLADSSRAGPAADSWALGVILYEALTGTRPFEGGSPMALLAALEGGRCEPARRRNAEVPEHLEALCARCLVTDPRGRPTAAQIAHALAAPPAPPRRRVVALVAVVALAAVPLAFALRRGPAPPPPRPAAPWPATEAGWKLAWSTDGASPELAPASLWSGPCVADPLGPGAAAAWLGAATVAGGRTSVEYDVARALRAVPVRTAMVLWNGHPGAGRLAPGPLDGTLPSLEVEAPNDTGWVRLLVGRGSWRDAHLVVRLALTRRIDGNDLHLILGAGSGRASELIVLDRAGVIHAGDARASLRLEAGFHELTFAPGAAPGQRAKLDGRTLEPLDLALERAAPGGSVELLAGESCWAVSRVRVEGTPERPDLRAEARPPATGGTRARVAAAFSSESSTAGGPFVALGNLRASVDGARLVIELGDRRLAERALPAPPRDGWLLLERRVDVAACRLASGEGEHVLEAAIAAPCPPGRVAYGSTAPRVTFTAAEAHLGPEDAARRSFDQTGAASDPSPAGRWREAARSLARVADPLDVPAELFGAAAATSRREEARAVLAVLAEVARALPGVLARDARARAVRAAVIAGDAEASVAHARALVADEGLDRARARVDALEHDELGPCLVRRLVEAYEVGTFDPASARAACAAAEVLAPERAAATAFFQGLAHRDSVRLERLTGAPATQRLEEARARLEQARSLGFDGVRVDECVGPIHAELGNHEAARDCWQAVVTAKPEFWFGWASLARSLAALERYAPALEASLGTAACAPGRGLDDAKQLLDRVARSKERPGLAAAAALALALQGVAGAEATARTLAAREPDDPRDEDLMAYARVRLGLTATPPAGDRPTRALALAAARGEGGERLLREAAARDALVRHVARLDPTLGPLLDRR